MPACRTGGLHRRISAREHEVLLSAMIELVCFESGVNTVKAQVHEAVTMTVPQGVTVTRREACGVRRGVLS